MKMKWNLKLNHKKKLFLALCCGILLIACFLCSLNMYIAQSTDSASYNYHDTTNNSPPQSIKAFLPPSIAAPTGDTLENLNSMFSSKKVQYDTSGYFSQIYESSLMSTFQALYILNATGKLDQINHTEVVNFIMGYYNSSSQTFMDSYAYRYLDTDFMQTYYPYNTILETTCYAVLSLKVLNRLDLINISETISFIRSCFHPDTGGFIGRPYDPLLNSYFLTATLDNTYYAVLALHALGDTWTSHSTEKGKLIVYIQSLQQTSGGFSNDLMSSFRSLGLLEPNLLSCYYAVKTLDVFGCKYSIRVVDLEEYLQDRYEPLGPYFSINFAYDDYLEIVATALGLQISDLMGYSTFNRTGLISFLLNNRNAWGIWDNSRAYAYHELIDTYEILRTFVESNLLSYLTSGDKANIASALKTYYLQYDHGFSPLSKDYTSLQLMHTIINAFDFFDRIASDMGPHLQTLYDQIEAVYKYIEYSTRSEYTFYACMNLDLKYAGFRSYPPEFYTTGYHYYTPHFDANYCHKNTFNALDTLQKLYKLDDFAFEHSLTELLNDIIECQFLNGSYDDLFGGFLPNEYYKIYSDEYQSRNIYLDYAYYAIKAMEVIANFLGSGPITNLPFNKDALYTYLFKQVMQTPTTLYCKPDYSNDSLVILENTYYMIYILKAIQKYNLNTEKIRNFVLQVLDYSNIKSLYYAWKISQILQLNLSFDINAAHSLVQQLYHPQLKEFYETTAQQKISQDAFLWICEMAKDDPMRINPFYPSSCLFNSYIDLSTSLCNLMLTDFGSYTTVKFESELQEDFTLQKQSDKNFSSEIFVKADPRTYPTYDGNITVYEVETVVAKKAISIETQYELVIDHKYTTLSKGMILEVNISFISAIGKECLYGSSIFGELYCNEQFLETVGFTTQHFLQYSNFKAEVQFTDVGNYSVDLYLNDPYRPESPVFLGNNCTIYENTGLGGSGEESESDKNKPPTPEIKNGEQFENAFPVMISLITVPSVMAMISDRMKRKSANKNGNRNSKENSQAKGDKSKRRKGNIK